MFKRVEKRRKRRGEEEKLGLDEETREILGFNDTDSDESDTGSESEEDNQAGDDLVSVRNGEYDSEGDIEEEEEEEPPISIEEALKNPVYLISMDPTVHGCVLCRGKIIKNADMAVVHKGSVAHKRRYDRFHALASTANSAANAWDIVKVLHAQRSEQECQPDQLSKRALKRQAKQAALKEKRKRRKELKAKAITKKAEKKALNNDVTNADSTTTPSKVSQPIQQGTSRRPGKRRKLEQDPPTLSKSQTTDKEKAPRIQESKRKRPKKGTSTKGTTIER